MDTQIEKFLKHCKYEKNLTDKSIKCYNTDLTQFKDFINTNKLSLEIKSIDKDILRSYVVFINKLKPKSLKRKVATLKTFFSFCEHEEIVLTNPFRKLKLKFKEPIQCPKTITKEQVSSILEDSYRYLKKNKTIESLRNVIIVELLFLTGVRVSELSNLKIIDINFEGQNIKVFGKGSRERTIFVPSSQVFEIIKVYLKTMDSKNILPSQYLLINNRGNRLSDQSIRKIIKNFSQKIGEKGYITPHVFRHTLATFLIESNVDISFVQKLLGHISIATTQIYTHISSQKQNEVMAKFHPRLQIGLENVDI